MKQDKKGLYSHPRWNDKQLPVVTGYRELTKEEKERVDREFKEYCEKHKIEIVEDIQKRDNNGIQNIEILEN